MELPMMPPGADPTQGGTPPAAPAAATAVAPQATRTDTAAWKARIDRSKKKRDELVPDWQKSVDYRRGKPFDTDTDTDRVAVTIDWSQTKAKQAQLWSQLPQVMLTPRRGATATAAAVPVFAEKLNLTIEAAGVAVAMDECLPDVINAAGFAAVVIGYETRQRMKTLPKFDAKTVTPDAAAEMMKRPDMVDSVPETVDKRFYCRRLSPASLLWPVEFKGSDFNVAPWLGFSDKMLWAQAKIAFNLKDEDKQKIVGSARGAGFAVDRQSVSTSVTHDTDQETEIVEFDELYYWTWRFDPECTSFCKIHRLVFVNGITAPVIDEDYKGQHVTPSGEYVGVVKLPVQVLTLTYISDEAIPPSDSAIIRPQVDELIKSRSQMVQQRDYSLPMRWFDVNRTDPTMIDQLMHGKVQGMVPVNGNGDKAIGEVARAQYPPQNFEFDSVIKDDIRQATQTGANQAGDFNEGERSASEANIVQQNFQTMIGYQRARVSTFFCNIAEVLGGLVALFGDFDTPEVGEEGLQRLQAWDRAAIANKFVYSIRTDSTVLLDANQRLKKLNNFLNLTAKSGFVDIEAIIREMASLSGLDPDTIVKAPPPKGPEPPNVSFRVSKEDVHDPILLAMLMEAGYGPKPATLDAAKHLLVESVDAPAPPAPPPGPPGPPGTATLSPGKPPLPPSGPNPAVMEDRMPDYNLASRINQRKDSGLS